VPGRNTHSKSTKTTVSKLTKESCAMADLDALKAKYAPVIAMIEKFVPYGATLEAVDLAGEQLHIRGTVPSTVVANRVWDQIKKVDPTYSDLHHEIGTSGGETQPYTIKSGDTLSAISLLFYGNANKYPQIAKANNLADPNNVPIGTTLQLPVII
jgi:nucleoid-associated protein YgaU